MITPATAVVNLAHKAAGWNPVICSHEELIDLINRIFIEGESVEYLGIVMQAAKGDFLKEIFLSTTDERYELYIESAASSKGRLVTVRDKEEKNIYEKDYLLLKKFTKAVTEKCEKELRNPTIKRQGKREAEGDAQEYAFCPQCGTKHEKDDIFCKECGGLLK